MVGDLLSIPYTKWSQEQIQPVVDKMLTCSCILHSQESTQHIEASNIWDSFKEVWAQFLRENPVIALALDPLYVSADETGTDGGGFAGTYVKN